MTTLTLDEHRLVIRLLAEAEVHLERGEYEEARERLRRINALLELDRRRGERPS